MRRDEVEAAWAWVEPILRALGDHGHAAQTLPGRHDRTRRRHPLLERDGRSWHGADR